MSLESSVAIMAGPATRSLLPVVEAWARARDRAAGFGMVTGGNMASYASVISGSVNYLDSDLDGLKAVIRDAVKDDGWDVWETVGLLTHRHDAESAPVFALLGTDGVWWP